MQIRYSSLTPLGRLCQYMNFERIHDTPPVIVTQDHRAVLVAAWAAARQGLFGGRAPLLVRLDAHPDMGEKPRPWAWEKSQLTDLDSVHAIANDQRHDDGGWVISAMQFGLAGDVASFFVHDYHRFPGDNNSYTDHTGTEHRLWTFNNINTAREKSNAGVWRVQTLFELLNDKNVPLWLDIDLDFATRRAEDDSIREWSADDWNQELSDDALNILTNTFDRASLVTIATEPWFCGGLGAMGRIAEGFKHILAAKGGWLSKL